MAKLSSVTLSTRGTTCYKILYINTVVNDCYVPAIIDTGAELNVISHLLVNKKHRIRDPPTLLVTAGGQKLRSLGETMASLELRVNYMKKLEIRATILENTPQPLTLGVEFLREMQAAVCLISNTLGTKETMHDTELVRSDPGNTWVYLQSSE